MAVNKDMNVLIVDDYNTMLRIMRNLLRQLGFENVADAIDGTKALEVLRASEEDFGLIISDSPADWDRTKAYGKKEERKFPFSPGQALPGSCGLLLSWRVSENENF